MIEGWPEIVYAATLLLLALAFWLFVYRRWRVGGGAVIALLTMLPLLSRATSGEFSLAGLLIAAAGILAGAALAVSDFRRP